MFDTEQDVLDWYEEQPRALTREFLDSMEWDKIREHPLDPAFRSVIVYMRDVESFTSIYHEELLRTPTGKNPVIKKFMERWSEEENEHAVLLNRFLAEAGHPTSERWQSEVKDAIPFRYTFENRLYPLITNCFGRYFSGAHMVWGAINEMTTLQGYRRLWELAGHPVLEQLLRAIAREESVHSHFYWSIARLKLEQSGYSRAIARFVVGQFWSPVGQGTKPQHETDHVIATLFKGEEGVEFFERNVNQRLQLLPGFFGLENVSRRIARIAL